MLHPRPDIRRSCSGICSFRFVGRYNRLEIYYCGSPMDRRDEFENETYERYLVNCQIRDILRGNSRTLDLLRYMFIAHSWDSYYAL